MIMGRSWPAEVSLRLRRGRHAAPRPATNRRKAVFAELPASGGRPDDSGTTRTHGGGMRAQVVIAFASARSWPLV
jgi:hypothetical protein